jgi:hypothetical protein
MLDAPKEVAYIPEMIVVRAGAHTGALDQHALKRKPFLAIESMFGLVENESP